MTVRLADLLEHHGLPAVGAHVPVVTDGAMGTEILRRFSGERRCLETHNLENPHGVMAIHAAYRAAGAQVLTTNTFGANRFRLASVGLEDSVAAINDAGARLARAQADGALVAGSIGPSGLQHPYPPTSALRSAYREQAAVLATRIDLFTCETFGDVEELQAAVSGIRLASDKPLVVHLSFGENGRTLTGATPREVVAALAGYDIQVLGANCCVGSGTITAVLRELRRWTNLPLSARPNAGAPLMVDGELSYPIDVQAFVHVAREIIPLIHFTGGCCGTTPDYIAGLSTMIAEHSRLTGR